MIPPSLDHLVFAVPNLDPGIAHVAERLGVRAIPGGRHAAWGTWNALVSIGRGAYLEIVAPDPDRADPSPPRALGVNDPRGPFLSTWALRSSDPERDAALLRAAGVDLGAISDGRRRRADGSVLTWRLTDPLADRLDGVVPFLIDWERSPHPSASAPGGCTLLDLRIEHPEPERVRQAFAALRIDLPVHPCESKGRAAIVATFGHGGGIVTLR